ncbi:MAG: flagellar hook assembly protein FlgD [Desulfobacterales bacterium]|nr:flagellar hook assembly protein FlgD [Desulfobacterales bacterium]
MSITGIEQVQSNAGGQAVQETALGKDDFLLLLVAQMKNQDPLNPSDSTEFTAQLAQFSSLEQLQNVNSNLESLQQVQADLMNSQAVNLIGKTIKAKDNALRLAGGAAEEIQFDLKGDANAVLVNIYDLLGGLVRTIQNTDQFSAGENSLTWDGTDNTGQQAPDGNYAFEVLASDALGNLIGTAAFTKGQATAATFDGGTASLWIGNQEVPMSTIIEVAGAGD